MNCRSLPVIVIVALVSGATGWFLHTPPAVADKPAVAATAPTTTPSAPTTLAVSPTAKVAAPVTAPAPASAMPATAEPAAAPVAPGTVPPELMNMITEMNTLVQSGDLVSVYENYMPPQKMAALTPEQKAFIENQIQSQMQGPNGQKVIQGQMEMLQSLTSLTPTMNSAGDHATYQVPTPKDLAPAGANLPPTLPINFIKVDGKWYIDQ